MAETRLSKVLIKQQKLDEQGKPVFDEQGNPVYVYTETPFAADIDDFMVYTDKATAHSVKDLVFGDTPPSDFITNGDMWTQLKTQADACQKTLTDNASFWDGLSKEHYKDPTDNDNYTMKYLATGDEVNKVSFYGDDTIGNQANKDKLVSLGALEDFAKRIPTLGGLNHSFNEGSIAVGEYSEGMPSGANDDSIAWNGLAQGEKSTAIHGMAYGNNGVAIHGQSGLNGIAIHGYASGDNSIALQGEATGSGAIAIGPSVNVSAASGVGIGSNLNVDQSAVVLGRYNASLENDTDVRFAVGTGTSQQAKTGLKLTAHNAHSTSALRSTLHADAFNAHGEWVATCARASGSQAKSTNPIEITQPLQYWTKAIIVLNGFDQNGNRCASQMVTVMPESLESSGKIYWYSHEMSSPTNASAIYINISNVEYNNSKLKLTLSVSMGDMTTISYACEFTGMAI